jgi:hypothetical protein
MRDRAADGNATPSRVTRIGLRGGISETEPGFEPDALWSLWRAAPTPPARPGRSRAGSRRWLIACGAAVAALLAGAAVALTTAAGPRAAEPGHARAAVTSARPGTPGRAATSRSGHSRHTGS